LNSSLTRISTGIERLDEHLGGGLLPGTLTVVLGATGIGKTQLGIRFAHQGQQADGRAGFLLDLTARGDSQNHSAYAESLAGWKLHSQTLQLEEVLNPQVECGNYLRLFPAQATRITQRDMSFDDWHHWQADVNSKLRGAIGFIYANFVRGGRRMVVDGFEPADHPSQSVQFNLFEFLYHKAVREQHDWVARELFREKFLQNSQEVARRRYDAGQIGCLALCTSKEQMLDDLLSRPLDEGDVIANANTLILMGKTRSGQKMGRALFIAKHRGSRCSDEILPYAIDDQGLRIL
jgi:RecA/RadA recombinase